MGNRCSQNQNDLKSMQIESKVPELTNDTQYTPDLKYKNKFIQKQLKLKQKNQVEVIKGDNDPPQPSEYRRNSNNNGTQDAINQHQQQIYIISQNNNNEYNTNSNKNLNNKNTNKTNSQTCIDNINYNNNSLNNLNYSQKTIDNNQIFPPLEKQINNIISQKNKQSTIQNKLKIKNNNISQNFSSLEDAAQETISPNSKLMSNSPHQKNSNFVQKNSGNMVSPNFCSEINGIEFIHHKTSSNLNVSLYENQLNNKILIRDNSKPKGQEQTQIFISTNSYHNQDSQCNQSSNRLKNFMQYQKDFGTFISNNTNMDADIRSQESHQTYNSNNLYIQKLEDLQQNMPHIKEELTLQDSQMNNETEYIIVSRPIDDIQQTSNNQNSYDINPYNNFKKRKKQQQTVMQNKNQTEFTNQSKKKVFTEQRYISQTKDSFGVETMSNLVNNLSMMNIINNQQNNQNQISQNANNHNLQNSQNYNNSNNNYNHQNSTNNNQNQVSNLSNSMFNAINGTNSKNFRSSTLRQKSLNSMNSLNANSKIIRSKQQLRSLKTHNTNSQYIGNFNSIQELLLNSQMTSQNQQQEKSVQLEQQNKLNQQSQNKYSLNVQEENSDYINYKNLKNNSNNQILQNLTNNLNNTPDIYKKSSQKITTIIEKQNKNNNISTPSQNQSFNQQIINNFDDNEYTYSENEENAIIQFNADKNENNNINNNDNADQFSYIKR